MEQPQNPGTVTWQLTIDTHDPHAQADFWAAALGAVEGQEFREVGGHWIAMTDPEGNEFDVE